MFITFEKMPPYARLWIYQADKVLTSDEVSRAEEILHQFVSAWDSHGNSLVASFEIRHHRFIIVAVNEQLTKASGCSIDKSVAVVRELENELNVSLFDRTQIAYVHQEEIKTTPIGKVKGLIEGGELTSQTPIFDNLIQTKEQLETHWKSPAGETWLKRYFQNVLS